MVRVGEQCAAGIVDADARLIAFDAAQHRLRGPGVEPWRRAHGRTHEACLLHHGPLLRGQKRLLVHVQVENCSNRQKQQQQVECKQTERNPTPEIHRGGSL
jgi:hypothetical protein